MSKARERISLIAVAIAVVALFAATELMAATNCSSPPNPGVCTTLSGWTITLMANPPQQNTALCPGMGNWEYKYQVCKPGTGGSGQPACNAAGLIRADLAIPDCCPNKIVLTKATGCSELLYTFPVGAGDPLTKFETGDQFVYAARIPYWTTRTEQRSFCANTNKLDLTSMCLDRALTAGLDCCKILGPACQTSEPLKQSVAITQGDLDFSIVFDAVGKSKDVVACTSCAITDLTLDQLVLYVAGQPVGTVTWLPYDTPIQSTASPGCTYVRLASGAVKQICK